MVELNSEMIERDAGVYMKKTWDGIKSLNSNQKKLVETFIFPSEAQCLHRQKCY